MRLITVILVTLSVARPLPAHEFWISPERYTVPAGQSITVTTRIGEDFKAASRPFLPGTFERYDVITDGAVQPVSARIGDDPVIVTAPDGLAIVVHETKESRLKYTDPVRWTNFLTHKDFTGAADMHTARGLPPEGFWEAYRRFGKSLVAVGTGAGQDRVLGLRTEIVALDNPYTSGADVLPVRVLLEGAPRGDVQVELFERAPDGQVTITLHRTNANGVAALPVRRGHEYLADAVTLLPLANDDIEAGPVWESLWASLTFAVPNRLRDTVAKSKP